MSSTSQTESDVPGAVKAIPPVAVEHLTMKYGSHLIQRDLTFEVPRGDVFIVMGGSGCGKSTLLRHLIGLISPAEGKVFRNGLDFWSCEKQKRLELLRASGVLFQGGALWSDMTLSENIALPLQMFTQCSSVQIREICEYKLALVGLAGRGDLYPSEISGGMRKRAGLARAMALDPDVLFFDEPSAGLDPISARRLDELILELNASMGTTIIVITHDLDSIFTIGSNSLFLDAQTKTMVAQGNPRDLRENCPIDRVRQFLRRE